MTLRWRPTGTRRIGCEREIEGDGTLVGPNPAVRLKAASLIRAARERPVAFHLLVMALFGAATVVSLRPLLVNAADGVAIKPAGDQLWQVSLLEGQLRALLNEPGTFFQGYFYYGMGDALYGSDLLLGLLLIFAPLRLALGNADLAFNLTWHGAFWLNAVLMYVAVLALTRNRWAALVAGAVFGFGAIQINYAQSHFQYAGSWWIPLALLFSVRFERTKSWKEFTAAVLCVWLQFVTVAMLAFMAGFVVLTFAVIPGLWWSARNRSWRVPLRMLVATTVVTAAFLPVVLGYLEFSNDWSAEREITEVQGGSLQLRDYLSPSSRLHWYEGMQEKFPVPTGERRAFPGFVPLALGVWGLVWGGRALFSRAPYGWYAIGALSLLVWSVVLSLGPHWKIDETVTDVELPYLFLFENLSMFKAVRVVARFALMGNLALALLSGIAVAKLAVRFRGRPQLASLLGVGIATVVLVESFTVPVNVNPLPDDADLQRLLAGALPGPTLFVPVSGGDEVRRIWFATRAESGPLLNGYSGFIWPQYWYFRDAAAEVTAANVSGLARALAAYGVRNVVLERTREGAEQLAAWETLAGDEAVESTVNAGGWTLLQLAPSTVVAQGPWSQLERTIVLTSAPGDAGLLTWLTLANNRDRPWLPPNGSQVRHALVKWWNGEGRLVLQFDTELMPPPFLAAENSHSVIVHLFTPAEPGRYDLTIEADGETIVDRAVDVGDSPPASFDGTMVGLGAGLTGVLARPFAGRPGQSFRLHVDALNTGSVEWGDKGNIKLGWRWYRVLPNGDEIETPYEGRFPLLGHLTGPIWPGNGYSFRGLVTTPPEPGSFKLRVLMVAEMVGWLDAPPVVIDVVLRRED